MKSTPLYILLLCSFSKLLSQTNDSSAYYYNIANEAAVKKNYLLADSLYSISLKYLRHPDTYFNRAAVRQKLGNTKGFCLDLGNAANMKDTIANKLFWKNCMKLDTIYHYKDNSTTSQAYYNSSKRRFEYVELIEKCIYTTDIKYKRFDKKNKLILSWEVINNDTLFYVTPNPPKYPEDERNISENLRYILPSEKEIKEKRVVYFTVSLSFTILENGSMTDIKIATLSFNKKYEDEIISAFKKYTKTWSPALNSGHPVKFRKTIVWSVECK